MIRIGTKLGIGNGVLVALCLATGLVSYNQTRIVREKVDEVTNVREPVNSAVYALRNTLTESAFAALGYLASGDSVLLAAFYENRDQAIQLQRKFHGGDGAGGDSGLSLKLQEGIQELQTVAETQIALRDRQTRAMQSLLQDLDAVDELLAQRIQASVSAEDPLAYRRLQSVLEMKAHVNALSKGLGSFLATGDPQFERQVIRAREGFERYYAVYQYVLISSDEKRWSAELRHLSTKSIEEVTSVIALEKQRRSQSAEFLSTSRRVGAMLDDRLLRHSEQRLNEAKTDLLQAGEHANSSILIALILSAAVGLGTGVLTTRSITAPLRQLSSAMLAIARGDRAQTVDLATSDELRSLGAAFNLMTGHLFRANEDLREEIASRRKIEEALRISEERLRTIFEDAPIGIGLTNIGERLTHTNAVFQEMLGYDATELSDRTMTDIIDPAELGAHRPVSLPVSGEGGGRYQSEVPCRRKDGSIAWMNLNVSRIHTDPDRAPYSIIMLEDITRRKQMEMKLNMAERDRLAALRQFAHSVQRAQEDERARISRELHDDLCQRLTGMKFRVEVLEDRLIPADRRAGRRLREFAQELDRTIVDVRRISSNLRPSVLDDFGLVTALKLLCKDFEKTHTIRAVFEQGAAPSRRVDSSIEIALYRIAQEALSNVARHAGATAVTLRLIDDRSRLSLVVQDNGRGFDRERAARSRIAGHGFGLVSMRERTELFGGAFEVQSGEGKGTVIRSVIPLEGSGDHEAN